MCRLKTHGVAVTPAGRGRRLGARVVAGAAIRIKPRARTPTSHAGMIHVTGWWRAPFCSILLKTQCRF